MEGLAGTAWRTGLVDSGRSLTVDIFHRASLAMAPPLVWSYIHLRSKKPAKLRERIWTSTLNPPRANPSLFFFFCIPLVWWECDPPPLVWLPLSFFFVRDMLRFCVSKSDLGVISRCCHFCVQIRFRRNYRCHFCGNANLFFVMVFYYFHLFVFCFVRNFGASTKNKIVPWVGMNMGGRIGCGECHYHSLPHKKKKLLLILALPRIWLKVFALCLTLSRVGLRRLTSFHPISFNIFFNKI